MHVPIFYFVMVTLKQALTISTLVGLHIIYATHTIHIGLRASARTHTRIHTHTCIYSCMQLRKRLSSIFKLLSLLIFMAKSIDILRTKTVYVCNRKTRYASPIRSLYCQPWSSFRVIAFVWLPHFVARTLTGHWSMEFRYCAIRALLFMVWTKTTKNTEFFDARWDRRLYLRHMYRVTHFQQKRFQVHCRQMV